MRLVRGLVGALFVLLLALVAPASADSGPGITAVFQGTNQQLEVMWVDVTGTIRNVYKDNNHLWHQPFSMSGPNAAPPGAHLTAVQQVQDDQLQLYWVGGDGALNIIWKSHNNTWQGPSKWSGPGFAVPGSPVTAVWQPVRHEMHIFGLAADGHLNFMYNKDLKWAGFFPMTGPNFGVAGAQISAVYEPEGEALEVFAAGPDGSINNEWKNGDGKWNNSQLAKPGTVPRGGAISATYTPFRSKVVVMWLDEHGAYNTLTKPDNKWTTATVSRAGWGLPGAPLSAVYQPVGSHVESFTVASDGSVVDSWKTGDADWAPPINLTRPGIAPPGATIVGLYQPLNQQLEVFWIDAVGTVWDVWKKNNGAWEQPAPLTSIGGTAFITPGMCTRFFAGFRDHGRSYHDTSAFFDEYKLLECESIMGITGNCAASNAFVVEKYDDTTRKNYLICAPYSRPDSVVEQIEHIGRGVTQGLATAFVAASPYLGLAVEGLSCVQGVIYACGVLAVDVADKAGALDDVGIDPKVRDAALGFAHSAGGCIEGNVVACAELGSQALGTAAGTTIPGGDIARAIDMGNKCRNGDFAACARLGQMATDAAGVKISAGQVFGGIADGAECLDSLDDSNRSSKACRELGIQAATAAIEQTKLFNDVANLDQARQCLDTSDPARAALACAAIGLTAAKLAGVPLSLSDQLVAKGMDCVVAKNKDACLAIGTEAAKAAGVPLDNLDSLRRCANGDVQICAILASKTAGLPLAKAEDIQKIAISVSNCVNADAQECEALAFAAIKRYGDPGLVAAMGLVSNLADKSGLAVARANNDPGWLSKNPPVAAAPPPASTIPTAPQPGPGVTFAGQWTTTVQNGVAYTINFTQDASGRVNGTYDAGTISDGVVIGSDLYAHWKQGGVAGTLLFSLAADRAAFAGLWTQGETAPSPASSNGTWDGYRSDVFTGTAVLGSFVGTWTVTRGVTSFPVSLQANGTAIGASYNTGFAAGTLSGTPIRQFAKTDVLSFTWDEQLSKGKGAFYLYPDGQRISGVLHTSDKALGTWTAVRAAPVVAQAPLPMQQPPPVVQAPPAVQQPPPVAQAPVVKLPRGACPGPEAVATQAVNVHEGIKGVTLKPPVEGGTLVSCLACDQSWCLIANANPHATVSRKFLDFNFAVAQEPPAPAEQPPPMVQPAPEPPPAVKEPQLADFGGEWHITSDKSWNYHMTFNQFQTTLSGTFVDQNGLNGHMKGAVRGNIFTFAWDEDGGYTGNGIFVMADDGSRIDGSYIVDPRPNTPPDLLLGNWGGTRGFQPFPTPAPVAQAPVGVDSQIDYGGCGGCGQQPDVPDVVK
jgi:hypothetical protein